MRQPQPDSERQRASHLQLPPGVYDTSGLPWRVHACLSQFGPQAAERLGSAGEGHGQRGAHSKGFLFDIAF